MKKTNAIILLMLLALILTAAGCEKNAQYYLNAGNAKYMSKQFDEAIKDLNQSIKMDPKLADAYMKRARCYQQLKKYDLAIRDFKKVTELEPDTKMGKLAKQQIEEVSAMK